MNSGKAKDAVYLVVRGNNITIKEEDRQTISVGDLDHDPNGRALMRKYLKRIKESNLDCYFHFRMDAGMREMLHMLALRKNLSTSKLVRQIVAKYVDEHYLSVEEKQVDYTEEDYAFEEDINEEPKDPPYVASYNG